MAGVTVTLTVPAADARAGSPRPLKDLLFDELLRRLEALERERAALQRERPSDAHVVTD